MIYYVKGDATSPQRRPAAICHVVNTKGVWGRGFVLALSRRWKLPEEVYYSEAPVLGLIQWCQAEDGIIVCNMVAQNGLRKRTNPVPLDYDALTTCLTKMYSWLTYSHCTAHMPRIGCGLAGGSWPRVAEILEKTATVDTYVYDPP